MSLNPNTSATNSKPRPVVPDGRYIARCYGIIDLGTHMGSFQGQETGLKPLVMFLFEVPKIMHIYDDAKG